MARALALLFALTACGSATATWPSGTLHVLFIGNSLTGANELPGMVQALAVAAGQPAPDVVSVIRGGYSLEDHWTEGVAQQAIHAGGWDVVVLQQGPSALPDSRVLLIDYTRRFDALIRAEGGATGLYMVWPDVTRLTAFDSVAASYRAAAAAVGGVVIPAGDAWQAVWRRDSSVALYTSDGFHPSEAGTYLTALVFYARLYHHSPVGLPSRLQLQSGTVIDVPSVLAAALQQAAAEATGF